MSKTGVPYLICLKGRYKVRVQVPEELRATLNRTEFKVSLGSDFAQAKRNCHSHIAHFLGQINAARMAFNTSGSGSPHKITGKSEIQAAVRNHYHRMVEHISNQGSLDYKTKIARLSEVIEAHLSINAHSAWSTLSNDARWLCEEQGWHMDEASNDFEYLCETMLQARLQAYRGEVRRLEGKRSQDPDMDPLFMDGKSEKIEVPNLGNLMDQFVAERELNWSASTKVNYRIIIRVLEEICGRDTQVSVIDKAFCTSVRDTLRRLPSNYQKRPLTKGKSVREVIEIAERTALPKMLPATINSHLSKLGAIVRVGRDAGLIMGNPMAGIEVPDDIRPDEKRDPFTIAQLNQIFATAPWSDGVKVGYDQSSRYWGVLIGLFSGARLSEIFGQLTDEIVERDGVLLFHFKHRPSMRPMKGKKSRIVPVHPVLIELGFNDFVAEAKTSGRTLLFPKAKQNSRGVWGDETSRWFSRKIETLSLKGANLSFHSLRHTFEDALREVDLHDTPIGNAIMGRTTEGTSKNYGRGFSTAKLAEAITKIAYPDLKLAPSSAS